MAETGDAAVSEVRNDAIPGPRRLALLATPEVTAEGAATLKLVLGAADVPGTGVDGCPDDVLLFTELVNGSGAILDDFLRLLPKAMADSSVGFRVLYHLNSRVFAINEAATAVQEGEFRAQKPILEHKMHMLVSVLAVWRKLRDELQEKGAVQTAAQQRKGLNRMVEKLAEVKPGWKSQRQHTRWCTLEQSCLWPPWSWCWRSLPASTTMWQQWRVSTAWS